jgi:hypothetical protein
MRLPVFGLMRDGSARRQRCWRPCRATPDRRPVRAASVLPRSAVVPCARLLSGFATCWRRGRFPVSSPAGRSETPVGDGIRTPAPCFNLRVGRLPVSGQPGTAAWSRAAAASNPASRRSRLASRTALAVRGPSGKKHVYAGEMAERLKAHAWKACVRASVPWVRIPLSPPYAK